MRECQYNAMLVWVGVGVSEDLLMTTTGAVLCCSCGTAIYSYVRTRERQIALQCDCDLVAPVKAPRYDVQAIKG